MINESNVGRLFELVLPVVSQSSRAVEESSSDGWECIWEWLGHGPRLDLVLGTHAVTSPRAGHVHV